MLFSGFDRKGIKQNQSIKPDFLTVAQLNKKTLIYFLNYKSDNLFYLCSFYIVFHYP
jgi:hypothetical protein